MWFSLHLNLVHKTTHAACADLQQHQKTWQGLNDGTQQPAFTPLKHCPHLYFFPLYLLLRSLKNAVVKFSSYGPNTHKLPHSHPLNTCQPSHTHAHTQVLCKCVRKDTIRWSSYSHQSCQRLQVMCVDVSKNTHSQWGGIQHLNGSSLLLPCGRPFLKVCL